MFVEERSSTCSHPLPSLQNAPRSIMLMQADDWKHPPQNAGSGGGKLQAPEMLDAAASADHQSSANDQEGSADELPDEDDPDADDVRDEVSSTSSSTSTSSSSSDDDDDGERKRGLKRFVDEDEENDDPLYARQVGILRAKKQWLDARDADLEARKKRKMVEEAEEKLLRAKLKSHQQGGGALLSKQKRDDAIIFETDDAATRQRKLEEAASAASATTSGTGAAGGSAGGAGGNQNGGQGASRPPAPPPADAKVIKYNRVGARNRRKQRKGKNFKPERRLAAWTSRVIHGKKQTFYVSLEGRAFAKTDRGCYRQQKLDFATLKRHGISALKPDQSSRIDFSVQAQRLGRRNIFHELFPESLKEPDELAEVELRATAFAPVEKRTVPAATDAAAAAPPAPESAATESKTKACRLLPFYHVPRSVCEKYADEHGIEKLYEWQAECLQTADVLQYG